MVVSTATARSRQDARGAHHEIATRYAWQARQGRTYPRGSPQMQRNKRMAELEKLYRRRYGERLYYNEIGRELLIIFAHHIALGGGDVAGHIRAWALKWMPDVLLEDLDLAIIPDVLAAPRRWRASTLGYRLKVTKEERDVLGLTTIRYAGQSDADMAAERKRKRRDSRDRWRARNKAERPTKPASLSTTKPWAMLGMSRASWHGDVIDTITSKVVLILAAEPEAAERKVTGRKAVLDDDPRDKLRKRKAVLDALREELRKRNYLPIVFDFETSQTTDEND